MNLFAAVHGPLPSAQRWSTRPADATHAHLTPTALRRWLRLRGDLSRPTRDGGGRPALPGAARRRRRGGRAVVSHYYGAAELSFVAWGAHADDLRPFPGVEVVDARRRALGPLALPLREVRRTARRLRRTRRSRPWGAVATPRRARWSCAGRGDAAVVTGGRRPSWPPTSSARCAPRRPARSSCSAVPARRARAGGRRRAHRPGRPRRGPGRGARAALPHSHRPRVWFHVDAAPADRRRQGRPRRPGSRWPPPVTCAPVSPVGARMSQRAADRGRARAARSAPRATRLADVDAADLAAPVLAAVAATAVADRARPRRRGARQLHGPRRGRRPGRRAAGRARPTDVPALTVDRQCASGLAASCRRSRWCAAGRGRGPRRRRGVRVRPHRGGLAAGGRRRAGALRAGALRPGRTRRPRHGAGRRPARRAGRGLPRSGRTPTPPAPTRARTPPARPAASTPRSSRSPGCAATSGPARGDDRRAAGPAAAGVPPADEGGTVTAGNSCGINDGAAAVARRRRETRRGWAYRGCGCWPPRPPACDPTYPGWASSPPSAAALAAGRAHRSTTSTWSSSTRPSPARCSPAATSSALDPERVCAEGGALGARPPVGRLGRGARGAALQPAGPRGTRPATGLAAIAAGGGQGVAMVVERCPRDRGRASVTHALRRPAGASRGPARRRRHADRAADRRRRRQRLGQVDLRAAAQRAGAARRAGRVTRRRPRHPPRRAAEVRRRVGFCFTDPDAQIVMPTVRRGRRVRAAARAADQGRGRRAGARRRSTTYGLAGHADHPAHLLSGGQKQLLALASRAGHRARRRS